jgi:hypothetical protein
VLSALLLVVACVGGRHAVAEALDWWWQAIERRAAAAAALVAVVTIAAGIAENTFVAGGSDSYCYLNQAELFLRARMHDFEPLATDSSWPGTLWSFVPAGHMPVAAQPGASAPICPAGYPLMLAVARAAFGRTAMFTIAPLLGGAAVFLAFVLGRRAAGPAAGLLGAVLTATSPTLLVQLVQPMNDVPAAALWCAALVFGSAAMRRQRPSSHAETAAPRARFDPAIRSAALSGLAAGAALMVRPNLVPLAAIAGVGAALLPPRRAFAERIRIAAAFGFAAVPGVIAVMAIQWAMYGSPLSSGYGDLSALFSAAHVLPNLQRYPRWLLEVHTPLLTAAFVSPFVVARDARRYAIWLLAFAAGTLACYLPYVVFDAWWYTRFLLPAVPPLLVLTAAVIVRGIRALPGAARAPAFLAVCVGIAIVYLGIATRRDAFRAQDLERRFRSAGEYVATLPANAAIVTLHQSGSVRFYSGRSTAGWADVDPGRLDDALSFLRRHGRRPYLLLETWEEPEFKRRFAADRLGRLDWPPIAVIDTQVRVFDPEDFDRHRRGEPVATTVIDRGR